MTTPEQTHRWTKIAAVGAWIAAVAAVLVLIWNILIYFDPWDWQGPKPKAVGRAHVQQTTTMQLAAQTARETNKPAGNGLPTVVLIKMGGTHEASLRRVEFKVRDREKTQKREDRHGKGDNVAVTFRERHWNAKDGQFELVFQNPPRVPANEEYTPLDIAIVEPAWVGWTYKGTLKVFFAGIDKPLEYEVEVDVLPAIPPRQ